MITSEITFFNIDQDILCGHDKFLESVGLSDSDKNNYSKRLKSFQEETRGNVVNFKLQFPLFLDGKNKKYTSFLYFTSDNMDYFSIRTETFFLNKHLKSRVFQKWNDKLSNGWFLEISNYKGFYKIYSGDLRFLKRYLYQMPSIEFLDLPNCIAFKNDSDWQNFRWFVPEIDTVKNLLL